jgi:hypothetical protein
MATEQELLNRIHELEEQNSLLRDKLDMIYSIVASDYEEGGGDSDLIQIEN